MDLAKKMKLGTGMVCPFCGLEAMYSATPLSALPRMVATKAKVARARREGGQFTSTSCGHTWPVESLHRRGPISDKAWRV